MKELVVQVRYTLRQDKGDSEPPNNSTSSNKMRMSVHTWTVLAKQKSHSPLNQYTLLVTGCCITYNENTGITLLF